MNAIAWLCLIGVAIFAAGLWVCTRRADPVEVLEDGCTEEPAKTAADSAELELTRLRNSGGL